MGDTPDPRTQTPIDPKRLDASQKDETGRVIGQTKSNNDPAGTQPKKPVPEVIGKFTGAVDASGNVSAELDGSTVQVHSTWVQMHATVSLKPDVDPDPANFKVGWVQNLNSSRRVGIYKNRAGEIRGRSMALGKASDRRSYDAQTGPTSSVRITVAKPWYDLPEEMSASRRTVETHAFDRPKHPLPLTFKDEAYATNEKRKGDAEFSLIRMEGGESFTTSLKAGNAGEHTLQTWTWNVPWDINLEGITAAAGKTGGAVTSKDLGKDKDLNPNLDGKTAFDQAENQKAVETFETPEAAAAKLAAIGFAEFVTLLDQHKDAAPKSYWNMIDALWKTNKLVRVEVWERDSKGNATAKMKSVRVEFAGDGTFAANQDGTQFSILSHMVLDPNKGMKTPIAVRVNGVEIMQAKAPYGQQKGTGKIQVPGSVFGTNDQDVVVMFNVY